MFVVVLKHILFVAMEVRVCVCVSVCLSGNQTKSQKTPEEDTKKAAAARKEVS